MYVLKLKCLLIYAVVGNTVLSNQFYPKNKFIGHDLLQHNPRRYNNFDYNFNDWEDNSTHNIILDYNLDVTLKDDKNGPLHNYDIQVGNPVVSIITTSSANSYTQTDTIPMLFITIAPSNSPESSVTPEKNTVTEATTEVKLNQTTSSSITEATTHVIINPPTSPETENTIPKPVKDSTSDTLTTETMTTETMTTTKATTVPTVELVMTFPSSRSTRKELTTYPKLFVDESPLHYPPDVTFPQFPPRPSLSSPAMYNIVTRNLTTVPTTVGAMVIEAHKEMQEKQAGYFTTFLLEVFKIIATKNKTDTTRLFHAVETEISAIHAMNHLAGFRRSTVEAFLTLVRLLTSVPTDVVQSKAALGNYLLTNRKVTLSADVLSVIDLVDGVYTKEEGERILGVLDEINDFPNTLKSGKAIVQEVMDAVVMTPFKRIYGSTQQKYLVQRLDEMIVSNLYNGVPAARRKGASKQRSHKGVFIKYSKTKRIRKRPTPLKETKSTIPTAIPNVYAKFSKNKTIKNAFKARMWRYKGKRIPKEWQKWRKKHTTTTPTTTTTEKVIRTLKSVYVIKKYVKKNLKSRKTRTTQSHNETGPYKLYDPQLIILTTKTVAKSLSQKYIKLNIPKVIIKVNNSGEITKNLGKLANKNMGNKKRRIFYSNKNLKIMNNEYGPKNNKLLIRDKADLIKHKFRVANYMREQSSFTDEEEKLKVNLDDAILHTFDKPLFRSGNSTVERHFKSKKNHQISSYSDEETVLKAKIYKAFGYENDFAEAVKRKKIFD